MRHYILLTGFLIAACLCALASKAEDMHSLGLSYTTMGAGKDQNPPAQGAMRYMAIPHGQQKPANDTPNAIPTSNQDATDQIWKKYKALAAGTYKDTPPEPPAKPEPAKEEAAPDDPAPPTGIGAIIAEYQKNKAQQKEMHHIVVTPPLQTAPQTPPKP